MPSNAGATWYARRLPFCFESVTLVKCFCGRAGMPVRRMDSISGVLTYATGNTTGAVKDFWKFPFCCYTYFLFAAMLARRCRARRSGEFLFFGGDKGVSAFVFNTLK